MRSMRFETFSKSVKRLMKPTTKEAKVGDFDLPGLIEEEADSFLGRLCSDLAAGDGLAWDEIREWMKTRSENDLKRAILFIGENEMTALHFVCRVDPPLDIINVMITLAEEALEWPDTFGWLPIHYACACSASPEVLVRILDDFPEGRTTVDKKGRAPLHFALLNKERPVSSETVADLASTGAATYADDNGLFPLHYATAYGSNHEVVKTLAEIYPDALISMDDKGRTPLLYCLANGDRECVPPAVAYMLGEQKDLVNRYKGGYAPLHALADKAHSVHHIEGRENCGKCLELYMNAEPNPTADLISAIQQLPDWLIEEAVNLPVVQSLLNQKVSQPFPTAVLLLDLYLLIVTMFTYSLLVVESLKLRYDDDPTNDAIHGARIIPLYISSAYFLAREMIQFLGVSSLGALSTYFTDPTNLMDFGFIILVTYWSIRMNTGSGDRESFRTGTALSAGIMWANVLIYLQDIIIDLAIFVAGVTYVLRRLGAFMLATLIILVAFSQMFTTAFHETSYCADIPPVKDVNEIRCGTDVDVWFCNFWDAILQVYTMMLGEVDPDVFSGSNTALAFFIVFFFLVVILLANVLIAIVAQSYSVVRNERAAIVFWTNRLDFVGEMDAIAHSPWTRTFMSFFTGVVEDESETSASKSTFGSDSWVWLLHLFDDEFSSANMFSVEGLTTAFVRLFVAFVVLPLWIVAGVATLGILWPPQVREFVFIETIATKIGGNGGEVEEFEGTQEVELIETNVKIVRNEIAQELATDRAYVAQIRGLIAELKSDIATEIQSIKKEMAKHIEEMARMEAQQSE